MSQTAYSVLNINSAEYYPDHKHQDNIGLPLIIIENAAAKLVISEQGAQVLSFIAKDKSDLLWLSPLASFGQGKAVRGGIPVCLPWFGVNQRAPEKPSHGFARNTDWSLSSIEHIADKLNNDVTKIEFELSQFKNTAHPLFEYPFHVKLVYSLGAQLSIEMQLSNTGNKNFPLSWAMHSYHPVSDISSTRIIGLDGCEYLDNTCGLKRCIQQGEVIFNGEVDRAYINAAESQVISQSSAATEGGKQLETIKIAAQGCDTAIVWNPGREKASQMLDLGEQNYQQFVCVERGNAFDNEINLASGEVHTASIVLSHSD
jgi:glucose-6-phosphate 1-epimerase